jgi:hypothetical protein
MADTAHLEKLAASDSFAGDGERDGERPRDLRITGRYDGRRRAVGSCRSPSFGREESARTRFSAVGKVRASERSRIRKRGRAKRAGEVLQTVDEASATSVASVGEAARRADATAGRRSGSSSVVTKTSEEGGVEESGRNNVPRDRFERLGAPVTTSVVTEPGHAETKSTDTERVCRSRTSLFGGESCPRQVGRVGDASARHLR